MSTQTETLPEATPIPVIQESQYNEEEAISLLNHIRQYVRDTREYDFFSKIIQYSLFEKEFY